MVITYLKGGLGNQMFQYAIARSLAHMNHDELKMDLNWFRIVKPPAIVRNYELSCFNIIENFTTRKEVRIFRFAVLLKKVLKMNFSFLLRGNCYVEKKWFHYDPDVFKLRGDIYLEGYWQTEKYFKNIEDIIRKEFTVKTEPDEINKRMLDRITNSNSVALHVRRGDFVSNPKGGDYVLGMDFYNKCITKITDKVKDPCFFIFSDEPDWCLENIKIPGYPCEYVAHNSADRGYEDMRLMSSCKHFIIANSTFSWWAAWLSSNKDKIVVAPDKRLVFKNVDIKDLLPAEWIKMECPIQ